MTDRTPWCVLDETKWVVNFQSFNSYLAGGVGCTTYSFSIRLGVYFDFHRPSPDYPTIEWPKEYEATLRFTANKRLAQPLFRPFGQGPARDRRDVFFVVEDGSNLEEVVDDARRVPSTRLIGARSSSVSVTASAATLDQTWRTASMAT